MLLSELRVAVEQRLDARRKLGPRRRSAAVPALQAEKAIAGTGWACPKTFRAMVYFAELSTDIIGEAGEFVHAMPYRDEAYNERTPLMREIRREGVEF